MVPPISRALTTATIFPPMMLARSYFSRFALYAPMALMVGAAGPSSGSPWFRISAALFSSITTGSSWTSWMGSAAGLLGFGDLVGGFGRASSFGGLGCGFLAFLALILGLLVLVAGFGHLLLLGWGGCVLPACWPALVLPESSVSRSAFPASRSRKSTRHPCFCRWRRSSRSVRGSGWPGPSCWALFGSRHPRESCSRSPCSPMRIMVRRIPLVLDSFFPIFTATCRMVGKRPSCSSTSWVIAFSTRLWWRVQPFTLLRLSIRPPSWSCRPSRSSRPWRSAAWTWLDLPRFPGHPAPDFDAGFDVGDLHL